MPRNPPWSREELILALDLYFKTGATDSRNPQVAELSAVLNRLSIASEYPDPDRFRNPNGVAMKLANFAALDPSYPGVALERGGRLDATIWDEFAQDKERLIAEAARLRATASTLPAVEQTHAETQSRARRYWALFGNPLVYRIEDAVQDLEADTWTSKGKDIRKGDRVAIWKGAGRDGLRGVIALGEVESDPAPTADSQNPYWLRPPTSSDSEERVRLRYVRSPALPLWVHEHPSLLGVLSVSRARGGTVFEIAPGEWDAILATTGGWTEESPEVTAAKVTVAEYAGQRRSGQGFGLSAEERRAVELHAMRLAIKHYESRGWSVRDVSSIASFDLLCTRFGEDELHVEVKGTTSDGATILLTPNEVSHARRQFPHVALFIVAGVRLNESPDAAASGGYVALIEPWKLDERDLTPVGYSYAMPGNLHHRVKAGK